MTSPGRSFGIPVLYSLHSLQQGVMASGGVGGLSTVVTMAPMQQAQLTTLSAMTQSPVPQLNTAPPITETPSLPTAQLYLCRTSNNATGRLVHSLFAECIIHKRVHSTYNLVA